MEPEIYVPPRPGEVVRRATGSERAQALYFDQMANRVPVGRGRDGAPIYVNMEFLDGTRGAHVSISGISGVATKTSFALFLLHSIFRSGALGARAVNAKALVFSVKGEDLLFLDQPNVRLDDDLRAEYAALGLPAEPFASAGFWAPPIPDDTTGRPNVTGRTSGVEAFWWTLAEFCDQQLLPYVFADAEDDRQQYTIVIHQVAARLRRDAVPFGDNGAVQIDGKVRDHLRGARRPDHRPAHRRRHPRGLGRAGHRDGDGQRVRPPAALVAAAAVPHHPRRPGRRRRAARISTQDQQLTVVDLHNLHERAQRFVVGVVLAAETARKEDAGPGGLLFTMIDELNKYAPREGSSPIKDVLLDIAERGRSLGIILIGAQQTASEVERRIVSNSAIRVVGRLDAAEAGRPEYGFLPASQRVRATIAKPGAMFVSQPQIPVPLAIEFPFPAWATRLSECAEPPRPPAGPAAEPDVPAAGRRRHPAVLTLAAQPTASEGARSP